MRNSSWTCIYDSWSHVVVYFRMACMPRLSNGFITTLFWKEKLLVWQRGEPRKHHYHLKYPVTLGISLMIMPSAITWLSSKRSVKKKADQDKVLRLFALTYKHRHEEMLQRNAPARVQSSIQTYPALQRPLHVSFIISSNPHILSTKSCQIINQSILIYIYRCILG